jgi:hypothetical protein
VNFSSLYSSVINELNFKIIFFLLFQVAWLRVDTQTILTIQNNVITKNHRVGISFTEKKTWQLRLKDVRESDKGWYGGLMSFWGC